MGRKKSFQGREAFHRMNFLYQACHLMQAANNTNLAAYYGHIMTGVAKKTVLRIDPSIKRTLCKGCHNLLLPVKSSRIRVKKSGQLRQTCVTCHTAKRFQLSREYSIWSERKDSIVEVICCNEETSSELPDNNDSKSLDVPNVKTNPQVKDALPDIV